MVSATVVTRGSQITLTREIREKLGIKEGDKVIMNVVGNSIVVSKKDPTVFDRIEGFLPKNFEDALMDMRVNEKKRLKRLGILP